MQGMMIHIHWTWVSINAISAISYKNYLYRFSY